MVGGNKRQNKEIIHKITFAHRLQNNLFLMK